MADDKTANKLMSSISAVKESDAAAKTTKKVAKKAPVKKAAAKKATAKPAAKKVAEKPLPALSARRVWPD
jgi:hypothetical protein